MNCELMSISSAEELMLSNCHALKEEAELWRRFESDNLRAGEKVPKDKTDALKHLERMEKDYSLLYRYADLSPEDIAFVILPQLIGLRTSFKLLLLTDSSGNGFGLAHKYMDRLVSKAEETLFVRQDIGHEAQILLCIYSSEIQKLLRPDALAKLVTGNHHNYRK